MYPNLYYIFKDWFGVDWSVLKIFNTFGFFVAIAFLISAWVLTLELKRKQKQGLFTFTEKKIMIGEPASAVDLFINFLLGFVFGYKIIGVLLTKGALDHPQDYLLSSRGNLVAGVALGIVALAFKYYDANKTKLAKPEERTIRLWPHDRVSDIVVYAFLFGFLGAKIFQENWNEFVKDPIGNLIAFSGLTFYGGLICAAIAIRQYAKKHNITFIHLCDAMAPTLMLAYALGRIGCQVSGDGDWGIINSAFITDATGHIITANAQQFNDALLQHHQYFVKQGIQNLDEIHRIAVQPVSWLPNWMFGYNYPHNVVNEGIKLANATGEYSNALPLAVFPTPFYETIISGIFFFILFLLRNKIKTAGVMFGIYLMMNGFERFWIEKIRVNTTYDNLPFKPTQAEIISTLLFIAGAVLIGWSLKKKQPQPNVVTD
ncbi:MAG: prolipoprotein diacylglyceryl transferase [Bacteroidetes bacterium]|nr:prolipoprotein diacylglyceryl transferase [Bacteroidota bacterium]